MAQAERLTRARRLDLVAGQRHPASRQTRQGFLPAGDGLRVTTSADRAQVLGGLMGDRSHVCFLFTHSTGGLPGSPGDEMKIMGCGPGGRWGELPYPWGELPTVKPQVSDVHTRRLTQSAAFRAASASMRGRSSRVTMRDDTAYSTSLVRRLLASFPPPPRIPLTPS